MYLCNYHTHTNYSDGENSVAEMAHAAAEKGFRALGFSEHAHTCYDESYCIQTADEAHYVDDVCAMREKYAGQMEIYLGAEDDFYGERPPFACDYTIGAVHTVLAGGIYLSMDESRECLWGAVHEFFGDDFYALCRAYFETIARVQTVTNCDFVAHFDLVTKFNQAECLFDEGDPRYLGPAMAALEQLGSQGAVFEINTGAMHRGYRTTPYPNPSLLRRIHELGGAILLSSDSHGCGGLDHAFEEATALARACGFRSRRVLRGGQWQEIGLEE